MIINKKIILIIGIICLGFLVIAWAVVRNNSTSNLQEKLNRRGDSKEVSQSAIVYNLENGRQIKVKNFLPDKYDPDKQPIVELAYKPNKYFIFYDADIDFFTIRLQTGDPEISASREEAQKALIEILGLTDANELCELRVSTNWIKDLKYFGEKIDHTDFGISYCPGDYNIK